MTTYSYLQSVVFYRGLYLHYLTPKIAESVYKSRNGFINYPKRKDILQNFGSHFALIRRKWSQN